MSYQVLARKWRPKSFADMVGQEHVLQALINALDKQRLHHAYLFTGTRGVGKTTIARALAKALNCEQGISSKPCGECSSCVAIEQGRFLDLIEVDAASRTKVEDTRELLENVQYAPTQGRFKVYLIDEVHMLSGHSFNALLKTLEEPPEHVKFLLATTDPQKLPITVLSRCLQFNLKNMLPEQIEQHLAFILDQENIQYEKNALWQLARAAQGSMRDGLSILDQAIAFSDDNVTEAAVSQMLGTIENTHIIALTRALAEKDSEQLFVLINELATNGVDFASALEDILSLLHQLAICQTVPEAMTDNNQDQQTIRELAQHISKEDVQLFYQIGLHGRRDLNLAPSPRIGFEMALLRMLAFQPGSARHTPPPTPTSKAADVKKKPSKPVVAAKSEPTTQAAPAVKASAIATDWDDILPQLKLKGMLQILASHCILKSKEGQRIELQLDPSQAPLLNDGLKDRIASALSDYYNESITLHIELGATDLPSPAGVIKQQQNQHLEQAEQSIRSDDQVGLILERFDATIAPGSIKPLASETDASC